MLLTMGGSDSTNATGRILSALTSSRDDWPRITVVLGSANRHKTDLKEQFGSHEGLVFFEDVTNMAELMAEADLAITAGGTTCWEMAFMGLPFLVVVNADNQERVAETIGKLRFGINLGQTADLRDERIIEAARLLGARPDIRREMSSRVRASVDGRGTWRICRAMEICGDAV